MRGRRGAKNNPRDYGISRNFGSGLKGLKNPIGDPLPSLRSRTGRARETREESGSTPSRVSLAFFLAPISSKRLLQRLANPTQKCQKKTHTHSAYGERFPKYFVLVSVFVFVFMGQSYLVCVCGFFKRKIFSPYSWVSF